MSDKEHCRSFSGAVAKPGIEPGSIIVTSGDITVELGKAGQLSALQGGSKAMGSSHQRAGESRRGRKGETAGNTCTDETHLATVAQLVGGVKREAKLGEAMRTREVQWRRRTEVLENAARVAETRLATVTEENAALLETLEKRGKANAERDFDREIHSSKLSDQVSGWC